MKRGSALKRTGALHRRPKRVDPDVARSAWKNQAAGYCQCGCGQFALRLERHHVLELQQLKREHHEDAAWDPRNAMLLHPLCHARHTSAFRRIPLEAVPEAALAFMVDVLGEQRAAEYIRRTYGMGREAA